MPGYADSILDQQAYMWTELPADALIIQPNNCVQL